jgi:uncharacterized membrane protein YsdA (DUF1294 family)
VIVMSVASFVVYWLDKRQATNGERRVSERTYHLIGFMGGWPGALLAQRRFRHKTQKMSFRIKVWILIVLHMGIVGIVKSRAIRLGMMLGALASCVVSLVRRESRVFWWSLAIGFCVMALESYLETLGTLMLVVG